MMFLRIFHLIIVPQKNVKREQSFTEFLWKGSEVLEKSEESAKLLRCSRHFQIVQKILNFLTVCWNSLDPNWNSQERNFRLDKLAFMNGFSPDLPIHSKILPRLVESVGYGTRIVYILEKIIFRKTSIRILEHKCTKRADRSTQALSQTRESKGSWENFKWQKLHRQRIGHSYRKLCLTAVKLGEKLLSCQECACIGLCENHSHAWSNDLLGGDQLRGAGYLIVFCANKGIEYVVR